MRLVRQEEQCGCGIACIAMVTKRTYRSVRDDFVNDFSRDGITTDALMNYLGDHGFSIVYKRISHWNKKDFALEEMLKPFAPVHIVSVRQYFDSRFGHVIVMDENGYLYCPNGNSDEDIRASYIVDEVIGLYK